MTVDSLKGKRLFSLEILPRLEALQKQYCGEGCGPEQQPWVLRVRGAPRLALECLFSSLGLWSGIFLKHNPEVHTTTFST